MEKFSKLMENTFKLRENGTTVKTEIIAGVTTFMTMEALMEILELPTLLKSAEPALDMAMNGMDATTII